MKVGSGRPRWLVAGAIGVIAILGAMVVLGTSTVLSMFDSSPKVLYAPDWRHGTDRWIASSPSWTVHRGVIEYSGKSRSTFLAPYRLKRTHYVIEATIRLVHYRGAGVYTANGFGVLFRGRSPTSGHGRASGMGAGVVETVSQSGQVYSAAIITDANNPAVDNAAFNSDNFTPSTAWHTYRAIVDGNTLVLRIDGREIVNTAYSQFAGADGVGLFSATAQIEVKSFKVLTR